ncbi:unnamed protein product [Ambrosiozyma monospora]|uniref:Unnamed protein product n=1 Tax=Ambrosiozyma monospora TaxID=43982 RepID=A0ACB5SZZ8_AMBMO|nr:unnamed protein product [Ambrosiozyma monospora]
MIVKLVVGGNVHQSHGKSLVNKDTLVLGEIISLDLFGPINEKYGIILKETPGTEDIGLPDDLEDDGNEVISRVVSSSVK